MSDWIGLAFFLFILAGISFGLKLLSKGRTSTEEEFEERASQSGSLLSAGINAINGMLNPGEAKGKEAITEVKEGRYDKKQGVGSNLVEDSKEE